VMKLVTNKVAASQNGTRPISPPAKARHSPAAIASRALL